MHITIAQDQRCFTAGKTGCGKSYLAIHLLDTVAASGAHVIVLDNKGLFGSSKVNGRWVFTWEGAGLVTSIDGCYKALSMGVKKIVYRPDPALEAGNKNDFQETMNNFFWWIYQTQNIILYIDEAASICDSYYIPSGLAAIQKRGRELNIGCWSSSQEPVNVHNTLMSQADHFFVFRTQIQAHRDKLAGFMGDEVRKIIPPKYHFWYFSPENMDNAILSEPI